MRTNWKKKTKTIKTTITPFIGGPNKPIVVVEDQFLRMRCAAGGQPRPEVVWYRLDGRPITDGAWQGKLTQLKTD